MSTATIEKNYRKLETRLENLEKIVKVVFQDELTSAKINKLEKISRRLDAGGGRRFYSYQEFRRYLKSP